MATGRITMESLSTKLRVSKATKLGTHDEMIDCLEVNVYENEKYVKSFYVQMFSITTPNKPKILANNQYLDIPEVGHWVVDVRPRKIVCLGLHDSTDINTFNAEIEIEGSHDMDALFGYIPLE
jgi:hypothetical protein